MNRRLALFLFTLGSLLGLGGCAQIDLTPEGDPNRVLTGTVAASSPLPAGAEIVVRILDTSVRDTPRTMGADVVAPDRNRQPAIEREVASTTQVLPGAIDAPVPFRIEYQATDAQLRRGLTVDVRVSFDGRVRYRTVSAHIVTLASAQHPHEVFVQPLR
jgi:uncharacterized lipoprotein YbaY